MAVADGITRFPVFGLSVHRAQIGSSLVTLWLADDAVSEQGARYCSFVVRMLSRLTSMYAAALPLDSCCQSNGRYGTVCSPLRQNSCRLFKIRTWGGDKGQKWQGTDRNSWTER